ncbi:MAG: hypothetical protein QM611_06110 [Microbacterium sp.]|uniref:hypothetical protein n=1 Tax=Microbacterium sp. TaxID=51671 RepID=UPI0039E6FCBD
MALLVAFPITANAATIEGIMKPAMDAVLTGQADVGFLTDAGTPLKPPEPRELGMLYRVLHDSTVAR